MVKKKQQTIEATLGVAPQRVSKRQKLKKPVAPIVVPDDSDEGSDDAPLATPRRPVAKASKRPASEDDSDDDEDLPSITSIFKRQTPAKSTKRALVTEDSEDDEVVVPSTKRRRLARRGAASPSAGRASTTDAGSPPPPTQSSPIKRHSKGNAQKQKSKQRELLRRRRAGENVTFDDIDTSEDSDQRALYDTDSDHKALEEFEDDDEGVLQPGQPEKGRKKAGKKKTALVRDQMVDSEDDEEVDEDLADFIDSDGEGNLGVPGELLDIPLEFTAHARATLKEHFRHVVEWLVYFVFDHNFTQKHNELYMMAWGKVDDEVFGLASSKFASSAWKQDFTRALNARPKFVATELPKHDLDRIFGKCEACGRSGHPATWTLSFEGAAYYRKSNSHAHFLEDVESDEEESSSSPDSDSDFDEEDSEPKAAPEPQNERDEDHFVIPPEGKSWSVGSVCMSNAETAHTLIHWKHNLLEWVGDKLEVEGHMTPAQIKGRLNMGRKKKAKFVEAILDTWTGAGVVDNLYRDFKRVLEDARTKSTTGRGGARWGLGR